MTIHPIFTIQPFDACLEDQAALWATDPDSYDVTVLASGLRRELEPLYRYLVRVQNGEQP